MKTLETLEQEAKQAREEAIKEVSQYVPNAIEVTDTLIRAVLAQSTYDLEYTRVMNERIAKMEASQGQKEVDADGWIIWSGGSRPVDLDCNVDVKFRSGTIILNDSAERLRWWHANQNGMIDGNPKFDITAYRISKGE